MGGDSAAAALKIILITVMPSVTASSSAANPPITRFVVPAYEMREAQLVSAEPGPIRCAGHNAEGVNDL